MDTLCIPVRADQLSLKLVQIDKMASIYKGAISSLVLDAELAATPLDFETSSRGRHPRISLEARARTACSVWMARSWTFQEGRLPPAMAIQFLDNAVVFKRTSDYNGEHQELTTHKKLEEPKIDEESSLECNCATIALEETFFSMFFEGIDFVTTWNELAGRSTTMPSDVSIIITIILDYENRDLLKLHDAGEMFQAIILSLDLVPLSIFFNTGVRHDPGGNHHNRWIPAKVSSETLIARNFLKVDSTHFVYEPVGLDDTQAGSATNGDDVLIYIVDSIIPMAPELEVRIEPKGAVYRMEPAMSDTDLFDSTGYTSTCIIVENHGLREASDAKRGACFYTRKSEVSTTQNGGHWWQRALSRYRSAPETSPKLDLTFVCPIRLQQARNAETFPIRPENTFSLDSIESKTGFKIRHGKFDEQQRIFQNLTLTQARPTPQVSRSEEEGKRVS
jgi:hypothetical protein